MRPVHHQVWPCTIDPRSEGPASISEKMAEDFKSKYDRGRFTRKRKVAEGETAPEYVRKKKSLDSRLRSLKAIFGWFKKLRFVEKNPFEAVEAPNNRKPFLSPDHSGPLTHRPSAGAGKSRYRCRLLI